MITDLKFEDKEGIRGPSAGAGRSDRAIWARHDRDPAGVRPRCFEDHHP